MIIIELNKLTTKELKNTLDDLIQKERLLGYVEQILEYNNYRRICLLDKKNNLKYNTALFQTLENKYAIDNNRAPATFKIDNNFPYGACADAETNEIIFSDLYSNHFAFPNAIYAFTYYANCFKHENFHLDDFKLLKYQKSNDKKFRNYQNQTQKQINKEIKGITILGDKLQSLLSEQDLQLNIISFAVDKAVKRKQSVLTANEVKFYTYLNPKELRPRISEFAIIPNTIERANQISDLNLKIATLNQIIFNIEYGILTFYNDATKNNNKIINNFFHFAKTEMTTFFSKEKTIYNQELFESKTKELLQQTYELSINVINNISKQIKKIEQYVESYTINSIYDNLKNSIEYITNNKTDTYKLLRINSESTLNYIKTLNNEFNLNYFKYTSIPNKPKSDTNLKFLTDKLYEIYNEIDSYVYDMNINQQLKENIQNIFINIFIKEENVYLIDSGIQEGIYNIVLQETELDDNLKKQIQTKIDDLDYLQYLQSLNKQELIKEAKERYGLEI